MNQDGGWVELVDLDTRRVHARGRLMVNGFPPEGGWRGHLAPVRPRERDRGLRSGTYIARPPTSQEIYLVDVEAQGARVRGDRADLPAALRELSDGE